MDIKGFHHLAIQVRDLEAMAAFYRDVLGLPEQVRHRRADGTVRAIWMGLPGGFLALEQVDGDPGVTAFKDPTPGMFLLALRIEASARRRVLDELRTKGVEVVHESAWTVYVRDPEGNRLGLSHHPDDAA